MSNKKKNKWLALFQWLVFLLYLVLLTYFLFFAELMGRTETQESYHYNLILFKEIKRFIKYYDILGFKAVFLNLAGNIIGFMPFGFLLPIISDRAKSWFLTFLCSFTFSLLVETVQLIWRVGSFDVDDLLLNTLGGVIGYAVYRIFASRTKQKE